MTVSVMFWPRFNLETLVVPLLKFSFDPTQPTLDEDLVTDEIRGEGGGGGGRPPAARDGAGMTFALRSWSVLRVITAAFVHY
jgi:hypothetical protein